MQKYKLTQVFIFILLCGSLKIFMKAFVKRLETPQGSVKINIFFSFYMGLGMKCLTCEIK